MNNLSNVNLNEIVNRCRIARKLGNISEKTQQRVLRRINKGNITTGWQAMIDLREDNRRKVNGLYKQITKEIAPILQQAREVEYNAYRIEYRTSEQLTAERTYTGSKRLSADQKPTISLNADWWKAEELIEREAKKAIRRKLKAGIPVPEIELVKYGFTEPDDETETDLIEA